MVTTSKDRMEPATPESGDDAGKHERIKTLLDRVKKRAAALKQSVRNTIDEAWELGDALLSAKDLLAHGQWGPWLESVGLNPRLAQRCMALRRRFPEKRQMSDFKSVDAAMRLVPAEPAIDAEFQVADTSSAGVGAVPESRREASSGSGSKRSPETSWTSDSAPSEAVGDPDGTGETDEGSPTIADASGGSDASPDSSAASRLKRPAAPPSAPPSAVSTSAPTAGGQLAMEGMQASGVAGPQTDDDAARDVPGLVQSLGGVAARCESAFKKKLVAVDLTSHSRSMLQSLRVLASALISCLEAAGDQDGPVVDAPPDLVPTLERLIAAVSLGRDSRS